MASSEQLKEQGNKYFNLQNFPDAINYYTKAIIRNPDVPNYYTNRALCHLKLKQWRQAADDCNRALEMQPNHCKAYYFKGTSLFEQTHLTEARSCLLKAQALAKDQNVKVGDEINRLLRQIKHKLFMEEEKIRVTQEIELQTELFQLLQNAKNKELEEAKMKGDSPEEIEKIENNFNNKSEQLNELFEQVDERRKKRDVPDALCSKIHFGIMRDPVITPSGITYDRPDILESLKCVGNFDPITRKSLTEDQLIPNLALKEVIDNFLEENPWAEDW